MEEDIRSALLTIHELSQYLNIKRSTLYAWAAQGKIPHVKIHGLIRFKRDEVETWVESFQREDEGKAPSVSSKNKSRMEIDILVERAKRDAYNSIRGKPDLRQAQRKEDNGNGAA